MDVIRLLDEDVVKVPLEAMDKEEAIAELCELLVRGERVPEREGLLDALYDRESKGSTGIGDGVAIPHARHPQVKGAVVAAGVSPDGIDFDAVDGKDVHLIFCVVAEQDNPAANVETLAEIGNLVQIPGVYEKLTKAGNSRQFVQTLNEVQFQP
jgi:mannitol/fructose-specific phosphotransferase system IIA component (Ntr-type)